MTVRSGGLVEKQHRLVVVVDNHAAIQQEQQQATRPFSAAGAIPGWQNEARDWERARRVLVACWSLETCRGHCQASS
jgi:hypothetical protein